MRYRVLGRTGLKVSELGLGGHEYARFLNPNHFSGKRKLEEKVSIQELLETQEPRNRLIERALDAGVNFFDTGIVEEVQSLGLALKTLGRRKGAYIAAETIFPLKTLKESPVSRWRDLVSDGVEERLRTFETDHIDLFNVHMPEDNHSPERLSATVETLRELREQGKIGAVGAASHEVRFLAELIRKYDCFDSVMIPYNYCEQEARDVLFPLCKALEVGVVAMKPFCWPYYGISIGHFRLGAVGTGGFMPTQASLRWILRSPEVSTVVPAVNTLTELEENLAALTKEGKGDEELLGRCLEIARGQEGRRRLKELVGQGEVARTRAYIRGYAKRALELGPGLA